MLYRGFNPDFIISLIIPYFFHFLLFPHLSLTPATVGSGLAIVQLILNTTIFTKFPKGLVFISHPHTIQKRKVGKRPYTSPLEGGKGGGASHSLSLNPPPIPQALETKGNCQYYSTTIFRLFVQPLNHPRPKGAGGESPFAIFLI